MPTRLVQAPVLRKVFNTGYGLNDSSGRKVQEGGRKSAVRTELQMKHMKLEVEGVCRQQFLVTALSRTIIMLHQTSGIADAQSRILVSMDYYSLCPHHVLCWAFYLRKGGFSSCHCSVGCRSSSAIKSLRFRKGGAWIHRGFQVLNQNFIGGSTKSQPVTESPSHNQKPKTKNPCIVFCWKFQQA